MRRELDKVELRSEPCRTDKVELMVSRLNLRILAGTSGRSLETT